MIDDPKITALLAAYRNLLRVATCLIAAPTDPRYQYEVKLALQSCQDRETAAGERRG